MSKVDWRSMTGREIWEALKSAPKIAGPWEGTGGYKDGPRRCTTYGDTAVSIMIDDDGSRASADERLRADGWRFADEPEYGVWLEPNSSWKRPPSARWWDDSLGLLGISAPTQRMTRAQAEEVAARYTELWHVEIRELSPLELEARRACRRCSRLDACVPTGVARKATKRAMPHGSGSHRSSTSASAAVKRPSSRKQCFES